MSPAIRGVRAAFVFLTRVPVGGSYTADDWRWAPAYFPLVGAVVGALLGALQYALLPLGPLADAVLVVGASMLVTGAMHEDGLADTCDALGGARDRARVFEILKDSRIGAFGACAVAVSILGRVALLAQLGEDAAWALPLVGCAARVGPVWQMATLPFVSGEGAKSVDVARARISQAVVATGWLALVCVIAAVRGVASPTRLGVMVGGLAVLTIAAAYRFVQRAGGVTGDFMGATEQLGELYALAVLAWSADAFVR